MSQTSVTADPGSVYEGKLEARWETATGLAEGTVYWGKGVGLDPAHISHDLFSATSGQIMRGYTASDVFMGVAFADTALEQPAAQGYGTYPDESVFPVLRKGMVWVVVADAITSLSDAVWIRDANAGGSPPVEQLGSFNPSNPGADYISLTAAGARVAWRRALTVGAVNYGLLELNL